jgi:hypothetical protein
MPILSHDERERIRETEVLKHELRQELGSAIKEPSDSRSLKHRAGLVVLGFLLTTLAGSWLTYFWSNRQWDQQQSYLAEQRALDKKYELVEKAFKAVAETNTAAEDILAAFTWGHPQTKELDEIKGFWQTKSREWRISSQVLRQNLAISFKDQEVLSSFEKVIQTRRLLGVIVTRLLKEPSADQREVQAECDKALELINKMDSLLRTCGAQMAKEIRS